MITEAHPKALLWLLGIATHDRGPASVSPEDLAGTLHTDYAVEHERDAALAAVAALAMVTKKHGWVDLVKTETQPIFVCGPVQYWLPVAPG